MKEFLLNLKNQFALTKEEKKIAFGRDMFINVLYITIPLYMLFGVSLVNGSLKDLITIVIGLGALTSTILTFWSQKMVKKYITFSNKKASQINDYLFENMNNAYLYRLTLIFLLKTSIDQVEDVEAILDTLKEKDMPFVLMIQLIEAIQSKDKNSMDKFILKENEYQNLTNEDLEAKIKEKINYYIEYEASDLVKKSLKEYFKENKIAKDVAQTLSLSL